MLHWVIGTGMNRPLVGDSMSIWVGWTLGEVCCRPGCQKLQVPLVPLSGASWT